MTGIRRFASVALFLLAGCASARSTAPCEPTTSGGEQAEPIVVLMDRDPERHEVPIEGRPSKGPHDALVTIVEITDFECPYCSRVQSELARVLAGHPEVRLVVVNAPMPFHRHAAVAAEAALEAFAQGGDAAFFRMHDLLFDNQHALAPADLRTYAERAGLDVARFSAALESGTHRPALARDVALASSLGVRGTPTFYINGRPVLGAQPYEVFEEVVVEELEAAEGLIEQGLPRERVYDAFRAAARSRARSIGELGFDDFADEGPDDDDEEPELGPETYELAVPTDRP
ncbi:MAG: thioredoxin domain-containing protein, partial [Polyangiaceae bacterium]|nr:thioredoxin domain-containing protein [Polyangiaceae bacterium]